MITLGGMVDTLGPGVLTLLAAPTGTDIQLEGVVIHDSSDPPPLARGNLVLAVGLTTGSADLRRLMERAAGDGAILVVKASAAAQDAMRVEAESLGLALVCIAPGAAWMQIASLLRGAMRDDAVTRDGEQLGGIAAGDLFALANAVAALVDAPVTIEDRQARVIAFSSRQDEADEARMATILGRQVPEDYYRKLQRKGVFRELYRADEPIYVDDIGPEVLPRVAVAVRAGEEVLGSIWAAVRSRPSEERLHELRQAANFVALHLLRHRIASDVQRELQSDLVSAVLSGRGLAVDAARRLNLRGEGFRVLAVGLRDDGAPDDDGALVRCWDLLALHLSVLHRGAVTALLQGAVYAVIPLARDRARSREAAMRIADDYVARLPQPLARRVVVGVGGHARTLQELPGSRESADRVTRVLRAHPAGDRCPTAVIEDVRMGVLLLRLREMGADDVVPDDSPLAVLVENDRRHGTSYVQTLRAYLDAFGDVNRAAARLGVHHNTFRYRLQKLQQIPGIDLADPEQRLALQLQLRLRDG